MLDTTAKTMTLPVLKKLGELVGAGAKVVGTKPERSPTLGDDPSEFTPLVNQIWSSPNVSTKPVEAVLGELGIQKDVDITGAKAPILYVHRQTVSTGRDDADLYWLDNRSETANEATISFRVTGKVPRLWNPQTGTVEPVSYQMKNGRTLVPLRFESWEAYFIVFGEKTTVASFTKPVRPESTVARLNGPWTVSFQADRGAPAQATFTQLASWPDNTDAGIKYFSGTATYQTTFTLPAVAQTNQYVIDLGEVKNLAEVIVNGKNVGIAWKKPFRLAITEALKPGSNTVQIKVTNLWVNRLIGDAQPNSGAAGATKKITFTTMPFYQATSPLLPSGLLGPVRILSK